MAGSGGGVELEYRIKQMLEDISEEDKKEDDVANERYFDGIDNSICCMVD